MESKTLGRIVFGVLVAVVLGLWALGRHADIGPFRGSPDWEYRAAGAAPGFRDLGPIDEVSGDEACDEGSATFLSAGETYVRDPEGRVFDRPDGSYDGDVELPEGAVFTGWTERDRQLWFVPAERRGEGSHGEPAYDNAYIVGGDDVERWPAFPFGCA